jgi:hypothetical protein
MYRNRDFGKVLVIAAIVPLLCLGGGMVGYNLHVTPPPTNNVPQEVSNALSACLLQVESMTQREIQWGDWAEIATR